MLVDECEKGNVTFRLRSEVLSVAKDETGFTLRLNGMTVGCEAGHRDRWAVNAGAGRVAVWLEDCRTIWPQRAADRAGLVPFTLHKPLLEELQVLAGVAVPSVITAENGTVFRENLLFTHRRLVWTGGVADFKLLATGGICQYQSATGCGPRNLPESAA